MEHCTKKAHGKSRSYNSIDPDQLGRLSVAEPVLAGVFGAQTGVQKNDFFRSLEGAKSLENL